MSDCGMHEDATRTETVDPKHLVQDPHQAFDGLKANAPARQELVDGEDEYMASNVYLAQPATGELMDMGAPASSVNFFEQIGAVDDSQQCGPQPIDLFCQAQLGPWYSHASPSKITRQTPYADYGPLKASPSSQRSEDYCPSGSPGGDVRRSGLAPWSIRLDETRSFPYIERAIPQESFSRSEIVIDSGTENIQNLQKNTSLTYPISKKPETNSKSPFEDCYGSHGEVTSQTSSTAQTPSSMSFASEGSPSNGFSSSSSSIMTPNSASGQGSSKPVKCQIAGCNASFNTSSERSRHNRVHHHQSPKSGPFFCNVSSCAFRQPHGKSFKGFGRRDNWRTHMKNKHQLSMVDMGDPLDIMGNPVRCRQGDKANHGS